jgi:hypothetical protein
VATASSVNADSVSLDQYRSRLRDVRAQLLQARAATEPQRTTAVTRARTELLRASELTFGADVAVPIDDTAVAARMASTNTAIDASIADIDQLLEVADRAAFRPFSLSRADALIRELADARRVGSGGESILGAIGAFLSRLFGFLHPPSLDPNIRDPILAGLGVVLLAIVVVVLARGLPERIRRTAALPAAQAAAARDTAEQLGAAERALDMGNPREALHAFYRYAILSLAERRLIRYEPSLTDRELLARAAGLPQLEPLRELVSLHDRAWFGLKGATPDEARRARDLARAAVS